MSDVFISYAREDFARVQSLVELFELRRWSVWFDYKLSPGKAFDERIEKELRDARCVVVVWSKKSVTSSWVKDEASVGRDRNVLVPVLIDDVGIPLGFKQFHAVSLTGWDGKSAHVGIDILLDAVELTLNENPWTPQVDLYVTRGGYVVIVELPGVDPTDIEVSVESSYLILRGVHRVKNFSENVTYLLAERRDSPFFRRIPFPEEIDGMRIEKLYETGTLILRVLKPE